MEREHSEEAEWQTAGTVWRRRDTKANGSG